MRKSRNLHKNKDRLRHLVDALSKPGLFVSRGVDVHSTVGDGLVDKFGCFLEQFNGLRFVTLFDGKVQLLHSRFDFAVSALVQNSLSLTDEYAFLCGFNVRHFISPF